MLASGRFTFAPARNQHPGNFHPAVSCRVKERRHSSRCGLLIALFRPAAAHNADAMRPTACARWPASGRFTHPRCRIHIGSAFQQKADGRRVIFSDGHHEGGCLRSAFPCVSLRARIEQNADVLGFRSADSQHERRESRAVGQLGVGSGRKQLANDLRIGIRAGHRQGSDAVRVGGICVGFGLEQKRNQFRIVGPDCPVQSGGAILQYCVWILRAFAHEGYGGRAIAVARGSGNLRGIPRIRRRRQKGNQASEQESSESSLHGASSRLAPRSGQRVTNLTSRQV